MKHLARHRIVTTVVVIVLAVVIAVPLAYGRVVKAKHPRDEARYVADLLSASRHHYPRYSISIRLRSALQRDPRPFIAQGDRACAWLAGRHWEPLIGPAAGELEDHYLTKRFPFNETWNDRRAAERSPAWRTKVAKLSFYAEGTEWAWKDLCRATLETRTSWPSQPWWPDNDD